jgi:hypothetical protein
VTRCQIRDFISNLNKKNIDPKDNEHAAITASAVLVAGTGEASCCV